MWGQESESIIIPRLSRIIPTRVGTRKPIGIVVHSTGDHPHACGDKVVTSPLCVSLRGSSPRVWGQVQEYDTLTYDDRIIPTRVGTRLGS